MATPCIEPIRSCLYGRHIGSARRHTFQSVSGARGRAGELSRSERAQSVARRALTLLHTPL